ncbi:MAG: hypothetical protein IPF53_05670 [Blastocatellia bacterium]|nr:hypothetical protein [Blastocatellia bacterium]
MTLRRSDDALDVREQFRIVEHQEVRLEEVGVPATELRRDAFLERKNLLAGSVDRACETLDFLRRIIGIDVGGQPRGDVALIETQDASDRCAGAHANSVDANVARLGRTGGRRENFRRGHRPLPRSGAR